MVVLGRYVKITCVLVAVMAALASSGCYMYREIMKESETVSPSAYYHSEFAKEIDRFNRDWDPTNLYE